MKTKYLIIGAGISGLTFANYAKDNYLVVEKEKEVGGYCRTIKRNGYVWDYAGHFFHCIGGKPKHQRKNPKAASFEKAWEQRDFFSRIPCAGDDLA